MASSTWLQYYQALALEAGTNPVKSLVLTTAEVFSTVSKSHLDKPDRFRSTISGSAPGTMAIVPVGSGKVQLLHHGSMFTKGLGIDPLALFVTGNRASAPIKILDIEEACLEIGIGNSTSTRAKLINIPETDSFYSCLTPEDFANLKGEDKNNPLNDRPNHMLLHPRLFELADGSQAIDARQLAWRIIENVNTFPASTPAEKS